VNAITLAGLQPLLDQFTGEGDVLSFYADLGVSEGFRHNWELPFQTRSAALLKVIGEDGPARRELEENLAAVRTALEARAAADGRWVAVFSAARRGFFLAIPLDVPVEPDLVLDRSPYLVPLLAAIHRRRQYLVLHTDTHRGRVYAATPGTVRVLAEFDEEVPKHQHSDGDRYGYKQATIARHREDCILHYRKELVRELEQITTAERYDGVVLLGEHEVLEHVRKALPRRLTNRVVREEPETWDEGASQIEDKVRSIAADLFAEEEAEVVPGFWDRVREGTTVAIGSRSVIEILQSGRLGADGHGYLVFGPDPREVVGRCPACRSLAPESTGTCPKCQAWCLPGNLWEELLLTALQHRIAAHFVADPRKLAPYGGVVAVLPGGHGR